MLIFEFYQDYVEKFLHAMPCSETLSRMDKDPEDYNFLLKLSVAFGLLLWGHSEAEDNPRHEEIRWAIQAPARLLPVGILLQLGPGHATGGACNAYYIHNTTIYTTDYYITMRISPTTACEANYNYFHFNSNYFGLFEVCEFLQSIVECQLMVLLVQIGEDMAGLVSEHEMFKNDQPLQ